MFATTMTDWLSISFEDGVPEKQLELAVETFDNDAEGLVECSTGTGKVLPSSTYTYCYTYIRTCVRMVHVQALSVLFILLARLFSKKKKLLSSPGRRRRRRRRRRPAKN